MRFDINRKESNGEIFVYLILDTAKYELLNDDEISECLNLSLEEYKDILIQNGGQKIVWGSKDIYFKNGTNMDSINIQSIVKILEPYMIMRVLTED